MVSLTGQKNSDIKKFRGLAQELRACKKGVVFQIYTRSAFTPKYRIQIGEK